MWRVGGVSDSLGRTSVARPRLSEGQATFGGLLPSTISSNEGTSLISGSSSLADCAVVKTSLGSSLVISAVSGSGSQLPWPAAHQYPRRANASFLIFIITFLETASRSSSLEAIILK
jgi:hypothetical protein